MSANARFLARHPVEPKPLLNLVLVALAEMINKIPRIKTTSARTWAQRDLPVYVRESLLAYSMAMVDPDSGSAYSEQAKSRITKFWSVLYSLHFHNIYIPAELDEKTKSNLVTYLSSGLSLANDDSIKKYTQTMHINICGKLGQLEMQSLFSHLRCSRLLTVFIFRKGANNETLRVIGKHCPLIQELNITGSVSVTDHGICHLLGINPSEINFEKQPSQLSALSQTLRFVKMRSTGVRVIGVRLLLNYAAKVEGIRCSSSDVLQALVLHLKMPQQKANFLTLKYLDFGCFFQIMAKFVPQLSNLIEARIGSDVPPEIRERKGQSLGSDRETSQKAALETLPHLRHLRTLVLKDFGEAEALVSLLRVKVGSRLTRLDLHFMRSDNEALNLLDIGQNCPHLQNLAICDSRVRWNDAYIRKDQYFSKLTTGKLLRVTYDHGTIEAWEGLIETAGQLRCLHLESSAKMNDDIIINLLNLGRLSHLEELFILGSRNSLGIEAVLAFVEKCPKLSWLGDLRDWGTLGKNGLAQLQQSCLATLIGWNIVSRVCRRKEGSFYEKASGDAMGIRYDTAEIVRSLMNMEDHVP